MSPSITCYIQPGKQKSRRVLEAFAAGCGARLALTAARQLEPGAAVFYGVRPEWAHLWSQAKAEGRDWYYVDNSYFDAARERQFRVTKNAIQHTGKGVSDGRRLAALGAKVQPMRPEGEGDYALVCAQSEEFMRTIAGDPDWTRRVTENLRARGEVVVRHKHTGRSLREDLRRARLLVTWSSASAVEALLAGVRVMCAPECCATHAGGDRQRWAAVLADNQWSLDEMVRGDARKALNA